MYSYENPDERVSVLKMNSELQHAQLELLSAHCATHQLRLHYSPDDLARFGRRDVLRKSAEAASALNEFYSFIEKMIPRTAPESASSQQPTAEQITQAVEGLSTYLRAQREHYLPVAGPLSNRYKAALWPYFSSALLDQIQVVELRGARVAIPEFFTQIRAPRLRTAPDQPHGFPDLSGCDRLQRATHGAGPVSRPGAHHPDSGSGDGALCRTVGHEFHQNSRPLHRASGGPRVFPGLEVPASHAGAVLGRRSGYGAG